MRLFRPSPVENWSRRPKQNTKKGYSAMRLLLCLRDAFVTCPDKWYPALERVYMEKIANWLKDQTNRNRIIYNVVTASLSKGCFCLLSRQMYWVHQLKAIKDTLRFLAYLAIFGTKRSQVILGDNLVSTSKKFYLGEAYLYLW